MIEEEDFVDFKNYDQLSFRDAEENVKLYKDGELLGTIKVWLDSEMDDREYICINYTIVYLDTLVKVDDENNCPYCGAKCFKGEMCDEQKAGGYDE